MFDRGYWSIGSIRGTPIRLHWSIPIGCLVFSGGRGFAPAFWLAFCLLVLAHELGHAFLVRVFHHRTLSIDITGFGGMCRWTGNANGFERSAIAWGGVVAQAIVGLAALSVSLVASPTNVHVLHVLDVFTRTNLILIGLNLLPFSPLDGAEAWKIFRDSRFQYWLASLRNRFTKLSSKLSSRSQSKPRRPTTETGRVIDFETERRQRRDKAVDEPDIKGRPPNEVADELIRLAEEAARARKRRDMN